MRQAKTTSANLLLKIAHYLWYSLIDTTLAIRTLLSRDDIAAESVGEGIVKVQKCESVNIERVSDEKKVGSICYKYIPAYSSKGELYFIVPGSRDLTRNSPTENCDKVDLVFHRFNSSFFRAGNQSFLVNTTGPDEILKFHGFTELDFTAQGLYRPAMGSSFPTELAISYGASIQALKHESARIMEIVRQPSNVMDDVVQFSFEKVKEAKEAAQNALWDYWKDLLLSIAIPAVIAFVLIVAVVIACKVYCLRSALSLLPINSIDEIPIDDTRVFMPFTPFVPTLTPPSSQTHTSDSIIASISSVPYISAQLNSLSVVALWDSGAFASLVRQSVLLKAGFSEMSSTTSRGGVSASGGSIAFLGTVKATIRIGSHTFKHVLFVVPSNQSPCDLLLGTDFMKNFEKKNITTHLLPLACTLVIGRDAIPFVDTPPHPHSIVSSL